MDTSRLAVIALWKGRVTRSLEVDLYRCGLYYHTVCPLRYDTCTRREKKLITADFVGWFVIPDLPEHRSARFLTAEEKEYAINRLGKVEKQEWNASVFRRVLLSWQFYLLPFVFMRKLSHRA